MKNIKRWGFLELIYKFEGNIIYDCHSLTARFERSLAQRELLRRSEKSARRSKEVLKAIIKRVSLYQQLPASPILNLQEELNIAWAMLLNQIENRIDPDKTAPKSLRDTEGWLNWARRFAV